ncbi:MAG: metallophosphoesterase family protein [Candidatus Micrarchaeota archaeon]|nr:metallophosphoesterase family protein [Candidatus Micrarchaeota archaeon]
MKVAIVSDMHIGYERFAEDAYVQAKEALEKASELADLIIMPGDIFDKRSPKPEVIAQAINIFRELSQKKWDAKVIGFTGSNLHTDVPVIGISGTHERTAFGKENPFSLLGLAGLVVDTSEATTIVGKGGEKVAIFGLGGLSEEMVMESLKELKPRPVSGAFNIFMFHQSTYELLPFSEDFIHYDDLPKGFDLYVDGHIHNMVEADVHGKKLLIPGSTVLTQLKDGEQNGKGFILFDTSTYRYEFVKIKSRPFVSVELDFDMARPKDVKERCEGKIDEILDRHETKPIIRLKLRGTIESGFGSTDMPLQSILMKYSQKAVIEIDNSKLLNPELQSSIEELRDNKIGSIPVKDLGMKMLSEKLKEQKFDEKIDHEQLFGILSNDSKKEKVLKEAMEFLNGNE